MPPNKTSPVCSAMNRAMGLRVAARSKGFEARALRKALDVIVVCSGALGDMVGELDGQHGW